SLQSNVVGGDFTPTIEFGLQRVPFRRCITCRHDASANSTTLIFVTKPICFRAKSERLEWSCKLNNSSSAVRSLFLSLPYIVALNALLWTLGAKPAVARFRDPVCKVTADQAITCSIDPVGLVNLCDQKPVVAHADDWDRAYTAESPP